jgi:peptide/nickel transport system substrate-binding protein
MRRGHRFARVLADRLFSKGQITEGDKMRRTVTLVITLLVVLSFLLACAPTTPTVAPTKPSVPAAATAPAAAATTAPVPPSGATAAPAAATKPAAAAPTSAPVAKVKRGGELRMALMNDWVDLDPLGTAEATNYIKAHFTDGLTFSRPDAQGVWVPVPALASEWTAEGSAFTFKLRKGLKFQDGSDFNAATAKWLLDLYINHPQSAVKPTLDAVKTGGVEVVDDYTIRLNLKAPSATLLTYISDNGAKHSPLMYSKAAYDKMGEDKWRANPPGIGPFQMTENRGGDTLIAKRFDGYWMMGEDGKALPYIDGVRYRLIVDDSVRLLELKAGNIDLVELMQGKDVPGIKSNPDLVYVDAPWVGNQYRVPMGSKGAKFSNDVKLRQAAWYALDREAIAKTLGQGVGASTKYYVLPGGLGYDESAPYYWYNLDKAKQLMKDAGQEKGMDATVVVMSRQLDKQQAEMLQQMWNAVGIRTTLDIMERTAANNRVAKGDFDIHTQRNPTPPDTHMGMAGNFASWGDSNKINLNDPRMDKCIRDGDSVLDTKQRNEIYKKCLAIDYELAYMGYTWVQTWNYVYRKPVQGFKPSWGQNWWIKEIWLDK